MNVHAHALVDVLAVCIVVCAVVCIVICCWATLRAWRAAGEIVERGVRLSRTRLVLARRVKDVDGSEHRFVLLNVEFGELAAATRYTGPLGQPVATIACPTDANTVLNCVELVVVEEGAA